MWLAYLFLTLLGLCVGSFLNVLIFRIPKQEEFVKTPSHCMSCGHTLSWRENVPLLSWLIQGGKCRHCGARISAQYPVVEALNAALWLFAALRFAGDWLSVGLCCVLSSVLIVLAVIDWRTFEIPDGLNLTIALLGLVRLLTDLPHWPLYLIGACSVGGLFFLIWLVTQGRGLGFGDVKLMAAAGLLLGWKRILLALVVGCVAGSVIHLLRMRRGAGKKLAFGPYLAGGIWFSAMFGDALIAAYLGLFAF